MGNIVDNPSDFINLNDDEIAEKLLDPKYYNTANLRELVKRCLRDVKHYKKEASRYKKMHDFVANKFNRMIINIQQEMESYLKGEDNEQG